MTIGDQPAFPGVMLTPFKPGYMDAQTPLPGMTYRQALIKAIAPAVIGHVLGMAHSKLNGALPQDACARLTLEFADAIIARMEGEK